MSQKSPAFSFYVRDWICSMTVMRMSGDQVKAYMYLLCAAWMNNPRGCLPDNDIELASISRLSFEQWMMIKNGVMNAFVKDGNLWVSERLLQVSKLQYRNTENRQKGYARRKKLTKILPMHVPELNQMSTKRATRS